MFFRIFGGPNKDHNLRMSKVNIITQDMDVERCAKFVKKNGHADLSFTPMDLNLARELNRRMYDFLDKKDIVMDLTTAALGYGLDYAQLGRELEGIFQLKAS